MSIKCDHKMTGLRLGDNFCECLRCGHRNTWKYKAETIIIPPPPPEDLNLQEIYMNGQETLDGGKKFDQDKPRWELLPYDAVEGAVKVLTFGAKKYDARNWEKGIAYSRVFGAVMRHLWKWWQGQALDEETGFSHLDHALCELLFLVAFEKRGFNTAMYDDRPLGSRTQSAEINKYKKIEDISQNVGMAAKPGSIVPYSPF